MCDETAFRPFGNGPLEGGASHVTPAPGQASHRAREAIEEKKVADFAIDVLL
jgi:hypothetical protein